MATWSARVQVPAQHHAGTSGDVQNIVIMHYLLCYIIYSRETLMNHPELILNGGGRYPEVSIQSGRPDLPRPTTTPPAGWGLSDMMLLGRAHPAPARAFSRNTGEGTGWSSGRRRLTERES